MKESLINYLPELIGGVIIAYLSFWLTRMNEKTKAKIQLDSQQEQIEQEQEKVKIEYASRIKEQQQKFDHEKEILKERYKQELEKYNIQNQNQDLRSIFSGEYDMDKIAEQMSSLENLVDQAEKMDKRIKSGTYKNTNHPGNKRN